MDLDEFMNDALASTDSRPGQELYQVGPLSKWLAGQIGPLRAASMVGTSFWQVFVESQSMLRLLAQPSLREAGISGAMIQRSERLVVPHANGRRFDLLAFVPAPIKPTPLRVEIAPHDLTPPPAHIFPPRPQRGPTDLARRLAFEAVQAEQPFGMVLAPKPVVTLLSAVPDPCAMVIATLPSGAQATGTVGVLVRRKATGDEGVTTAAHVTSGVPVSQNGNRLVDVTGKSGTILDEDILSDTSFIKLDPNDLPAVGTKGTKGVMSGVVPHLREAVTFTVQRPDDFDPSKNVSVSRTAYVTAWSMELPDVDHAINQLKVYTTLETQPGDSGTAIINPDEYVVGFAHERSVQSAAQFSSWIWAEQATKALQLETL